MNDPNTQKHRWIDTTISVQKMLLAIIAAIIGFTGAYYGIVGRVQALESNDKEQDRHFIRVEATIQEQRSDTRDALRSIGQDVKDLANKFDQMKDQMIANSAGNRPDMQRWAK